MNKSLKTALELFYCAGFKQSPGVNPLLTKKYPAVTQRRNVVIAAPRQETKKPPRNQKAIHLLRSACNDNSSFHVFQNYCTCSASAVADPRHPILCFIGL
jgi:hypothetical protein